MMPKVSVTIATYNRFEMVSQAIDAALQQTLMPYEIIVVDDCSPDKSYDRLKERYKNEPIVKVFKQEKNTGGVPNWNAAIDYATGDYIAWCSDDDRFFENHLELAMDFLNSHSDVSFIHANFATIHELEGPSNFNTIDTSILSQLELNTHRFNKPFIISRENIFNYYHDYFNWPFHPSTFVFKNQVWNTIGPFNPSYELSDSDWYVKVAAKFKIALLPYYGALNRRHSNNWSKQMGSMAMQKEFFEMIFNAIDSKGFDFDKNQKAQLTKKWEIKNQTVIRRIFYSRSLRRQNKVAKSARNYLVELLSKNKDGLSSKFIKWKYSIIQILLNIVSPLFLLIKGRNKKPSIE